jgi:isoleucyl-tRNA synthetase
MDKFSADSLRFLLLSSPLLNGEDFALQDKEVGDVARKLSMVWNMYDFFTMYAEVDGWEYDGILRDPITGGFVIPDSDRESSKKLDSHAEHENDSRAVKNPLDIWIISRVHQLASEIEQQMDGYNIPDAMSPILPFLDDASNWFVRRSRRRFWKSEDDGDKADAYKTLHYVLVRLAYLLAPFTPFLAEELYHNLTGDTESVHLKDWLPAGHVNQIQVDQMNQARELINEGLGQRAKEGVKVRQPLRLFEIRGTDAKNLVEYEEVFKEELNVKSVLFNDQTIQSEDAKDRLIGELTFAMDDELRREGLMREVVRHVQAARKSAGLNVDDHILLQLVSDDGELSAAITEHAETIKAETLADDMTSVIEGVDSTVTVEGVELKISLRKA